MKQSILAFLILFPSFIFSQTVTKMPVRLLEIGGTHDAVFVSRSVIETDTTYIFIYQDQRYSTLLPLVTQQITKEELNVLYKSIEAAKKASPGDMVSGAVFSISKMKGGFGSMQYSFIDKGIFYCNEKHLKQIEEMIQKEIAVR